MRHTARVLALLSALLAAVAVTACAASFSAPSHVARMIPRALGARPTLCTPAAGAFTSMCSAHAAIGGRVQP